MKVKFTLTLLASLILVACSNGDDGNSQTNEQPKTELNSPQKPMSKTEAKKADTAEQSKQADKNSESKIENSPQSVLPKTNEKSSTKSPKPELGKSMGDIAQPSDQSVFDKLSISSNDNKSLKGDDIYQLKLEGKDIKLTLLSEDKFTKVIEPQIETLRDSNGVLVGYTGYAKVNEKIFNDYNEVTSTKLRNIYIQDMDSAQAQLPVASTKLIYKGAMNYYYSEKEGGEIGQNQIADVNAIYDGSNKTLSMDIEDRETAEGKYWKLYDQRQVRASSDIKVENDGSVSGYLLELTANKQKPSVNSNYNASFTGGFYGKDGQFLVGEAKSLDEKTWQGIIKAEPEKKNQ